MTVGRNKQCSCVLKDDSASSRHIRVLEDGDGLAIEDLGSTNGVRLEGGSILVRGARQRLAEGLRFWLGETEVLVREEKPAARSPAARPAAPAPPPSKAPAPAPTPPDAEQTLARSPTPGKPPGAPPAPRAPETPPRAAPPKETPVPAEEATLGGGASPFRVGSGLASPPRAPVPPRPAEVEDAPTLGGASPFRMGGALAGPPASRPDPDMMEEAPTLSGPAPFRPEAGKGPAPRPPAPSGDLIEDAPTLSGGMQFAFRVGPEALSPPLQAGAPGGDAPFVLDAAGAPPEEDVELTMMSAGAGPRVGGSPPAPAPPAAPPPPRAEPAGPPARAPEPEAEELAAPAGAPRPFEATQVSSNASPASQASLEALDPRIVLVLSPFKRVVRMRGSEFVVGRGEEVDLEIIHPTISNRHAVIRFERGQFTIEDAGSKNGTFLDKAQLRENSRYDLRPESHVRFAAADALFLAKDPTDPEGIIDQRAAKILVGRKKVTAAQVKSAAAEGQGHLGERLLLETDLQVSDWVGAVREASMNTSRPLLGGKLLPVIVGAVAIIIIALLLVWLWR